MQVLSSPKSKKDDLFCHLGAKGVGLGDGLAALEGTHEGDGICMPKASAGGHPLGQAGDAAICLGKELGQVEGGGLTLHIASDGENKLAAGVGCHARPEGLEGEVLGHDAIERGDFATQAVVEAAEGAAALNGEHICGLLDDADLGSIAGGVAAGDALLWKPWIFGLEDSHLHLATHSGILSSHQSTAPYRYSFGSMTMLLYHSSLDESAASVLCFSPGHFRRRTSRLVSYYALFECMAASEPTS